MSISLPASIDAQLDAMFEEHATAANATTDPASQDPDGSPQVLEATADDSDLDAAETLTDDADDDGSLDAAVSDGDEEDDASADADSESDADHDEWAGVPQPVRDRLERAERLAAESAAREEERRIAEQNARANAQFEQWQKTLADMDIEDRQAEIIKVLSDGLGRTMLQQQQEQAIARTQAEFQQQHTATLEFVSSGHRVEPTGRRMADGSPEYRRVDGASLPLTESERKIVAKVKGNPLEMQQAADELVAMRRGQTAAARQALAQKRRETNEPPTIGAGRQGAGPKQPDTPDYGKHKRLDDKLDAFFDYADQLNGGPLAGSARR